MINTEHHRQMADNALDGFNISKQTLANTVLALCDEIDRLRAAQLKPDTTTKQSATPDMYDMPDIFGPIFGRNK